MSRWQFMSAPGCFASTITLSDQDREALRLFLNGETTT